MLRTATHATRTAAVLAALALSVSACGGGDDGGAGKAGSSSSARSARDTKAAKAISDQIVKQGSGAASPLKVTRKQGDCIGTGMVDKVGTDDLVTYKVLTKDLKPGTGVSGVTGATMSAADAKATTDVFFGCADVKALITKAVDSAGSLPASVRTCFDKALSEPTLRAFLTSTFEGKTDAAQKKLTSAVASCAQGG